MLCPEDRYTDVKSRSDYFDYPGNVFQRALLDGLDCHSDVQVVTAPNIKHYKGLIFKASSFSHNGKSKDVCISEFDILGLKELISAWKLKRVVKNYNNLDAVIIYSTSFPALYAASYLKRRYPNVRILNVITDLPQFMSSGNSSVYSFLKSVGIGLYNIYSKYIDGYILLAPKMIDRLPCKNIPWIQVEGIFSITDLIEGPKDKEDKAILYSGALSAKYGIITLLDALQLIDDEDVKLYLCGSGDAVPTIRERAENDKRINYLGVLDHSEVKALQKKVSLLINPRPSGDEYTMYSFPSKTIEYMASATPVLMTRLKCLPDDYCKYLYFIESETPKGIKDKIIEIYNKPTEERRQKGKSASDFILSKKNASAQALRIINFIKNLK